MKDRVRNDIGTKAPLENWADIDWKLVKKRVRNLRQRIYRATQNHQWNKVRSLMKLMLRSYSNLLLSARRVTQENQGKKTAGIDNQTALTPTERVRLVRQMREYSMWKVHPTKRVYIPKANGKQRPLGIPTIKDRYEKPKYIYICRASDTLIERHVKVKGTASPDDPTLSKYWNERQTKYGKSYWAKGSKLYKVAEQQDWNCPVCGEHLFNKEELHTHHRVQVKDGGNNKIENLIHMHKICHQHLHIMKNTGKQEA